MSASLVGSEMCIRDSMLATLLNNARRGLGLMRMHRIDDARIAAWTRCESVSYTHLTLPTICSV
eukprot:10557663-Alexandrium_andersonii.AAC.1